MVLNCFYTQCHSCASGKVPKSEDVYSPCKLLSLFSTVAVLNIFAWPLRTLKTQFLEFLKLLYSFHSIDVHLHVCLYCAYPMTGQNETLNFEPWHTACSGSSRNALHSSS